MIQETLSIRECNWYTRSCPLNGGVRYRECPLKEDIHAVVTASIVLITRSYYLVEIVNILAWQMYTCKAEKGKYFGRDRELWMQTHTNKTIFNV